MLCIRAGRRSDYCYGTGQVACRIPKETTKALSCRVSGMAEKWDEKYGDREIKLVFIGQHMDRHAIVDALDECLSD